MKCLTQQVAETVLIAGRFVSLQVMGRKSCLSDGRAWARYKKQQNVLTPGFCSSTDEGEDDEIVILDVNGLTKENIDDIIINGDSSAFASRIYRPGAGTLVEVDAA